MAFPAESTKADPWTTSRVLAYLRSRNRALTKRPNTLRSVG
jgi:hypothetical protein